MRGIESLPVFLLLTEGSKFTSQMIITQSSTKAEIIDASCEVIDTQQEKISELQERQLALWSIVGVLVVLLAFGA